MLSLFMLNFVSKKERKGMKNSLLSLLMVLIVSTSCSDRYAVTGVSNVQGLEGKMLFLKVYHDDDMVNLDSSRVVHGRFKFSGIMDSVMMANLFVDGSCVMPVVLEDGSVSVKIDEATQSVTGTPLNDSLSNFITRKTQIEAQMAELPHIESQLIMEGIDHDEIVMELSRQAEQLEAQNDRLVTDFIRANYNNVLGPGVFMILTSGFRYPILNPQIDEIISQATPYFLGHPYVQDYIKAAESNMEKLREY